MNIVIRADASIEIGTGHVMRCLTLAGKLIEFGAKVTFICRNLPGNSISYIRNQGMHVEILTGSPNDLIENTQNILKSLDFQIDLLIIDHYEIDVQSEKLMRTFVKKIMVIDDLANREHDCDILLDQNFHLNFRERYDKLVPAHCLKLLGPQYVLLRDEFIFAKKTLRKRTAQIKNILVFFGGSDPTNETEKAIRALEPLARKFHFHTHVVVGQANPYKEKIEELCTAIPGMYFYCQVNNIAELMVLADLAIGAGGTTTWERCFLKLPSITIVTAMNQLECTLAVSRVHATNNLGTSSYVSDKTIEEATLYYLENPEKLNQMSINCGLVITSTFSTAHMIIQQVTGENS